MNVPPVESHFDRLLAPRSIAVLGASDTGPTADLMSNLRALGFAGSVQPVNPVRASVGGLACVPSVRDCASVPDLAVLAVSTERLPDAVRDCTAAGVPGALIYTSGLAESGAAGVAVQEEITQVAAAARMRILGPNCLGYVNVRASTATALFPTASLPRDLTPGPVELVSQSGGLMISCLELGSRLGVRFNMLVSTGNECDVTTLDCLDRAVGDVNVATIGLVIERLADGRRFMDLAERALQLDKPIAVLRLGRTAGGRAAAATHTASVVGPFGQFAAVCAEFGVSVCRTPAELVERMALFSRRKRPSDAQGRLAVVTMSGGTRVLVTDLVADEGLPLAELSDETKRRLHAALPDFAAVDNPLDLTPAGVQDTRVVRECLDALAADSYVGTVALTLHLKNGGGSSVQQDLIEEFCAAAERSVKQFAVISSIPEGISGHWRERAAGPVPFLNDLTAFRALCDLSRFEQIRAEWRPAPAPLAGLGRAVDVMSEADAYRLLAEIGVPVAPWRLVGSADEAVEAAADLGYPVAVKSCSARILHKTEAGAVVLDLSNAEQVRDGYERVLRALPAGEPRVALVQAMAPSGLELLIGTSESAEFGPVVTVGLGGVWTELLGDSMSRPCPVSESAAGAMLRSLRAAPLLDGVRGRPPIDVAAVAQVISAVSRAAAGWLAQVSAIEINPLIARPDGVLAVDGVVLARVGQPGERRDHVA